MQIIEGLFGTKCDECGKRIKGEKFPGIGPGWLCQSCHSKLEEERKEKKKLFGQKPESAKGATTHTRNTDQTTIPSKPDSTKANAEKLYQQGLQLATQENFRQAIPILEEAAASNPLSAPIHQVLAFSYSQHAGEYATDKAAMNSWVAKAANTFSKAVTLHREGGGLEPKQLQMAIEFVAAVDRLNLANSNTVPEPQRKQIFARYQSAKNSGSSSFESVAQDMMRGDSVNDMFRALQQHKQHDSAAGERAIEAVAAEFKISARELRAIIQEGESHKW